MNRLHITLAAIAIFVAGVLVGRINIPSNSRFFEKSAIARSPSSITRPNSQQTLIGSSPKSDHSTLSQLSRATQSLTRPMIAPAKVLKEMHFKPLHGDHRFGELRLSEPMISVLNLNGLEIDRVNLSLKTLEESIREIERRLIVRDNEPDSPSDAIMREEYGISPDAEKLVIPPFPDEAKPLRAEFERSLNDAIGLEKAAIVLERLANEFDTRFGRFGDVQRTILIDMPPDNKDVTRIKFHIQISEPNDRGGMKISVQSDSFESVPYALQHLVDIE